MRITRRTFLKKGAKVTAAMSIAPSMVTLSSKEAEATQRDLNLRYSQDGVDHDNSPFLESGDNKTVVTGNVIFKKAELSPSKIFAGDNAEFVITLIIGKEYTSGPSRIIFDFPTTLGQSGPTLMHHEDHGYIEVYVNNPNVVYTKRIWDIEIADFVTKKNKSWRGKAGRIFVLDLSEGLREGDMVEVHWGDNQRGFGAGTNVTCVVPLPDYENIIHVRYFDDRAKGLPDYGRSFKGYTRPIPKLEIPLSFRVLQRKPNHIRCIRKVDKALLIPHDRYWNVALVKVATELVDATEKPVRNELGVFEYKDKHIHISSPKLPFVDSPNMDNVFEGMNIYWGELHSHSAFSVDCIEREKMQMLPGDLMKYARQCAGLDFYAVSDHHQPWDEERHKIGRENWERTTGSVQKYDQPGEFLVFPGIEFRGPRGDTVLTFGWLPEYHEIDHPEWKDIRDVWKGLKGKDYLSHPHFHNPGKLTLGDWWDNINSDVEPVLEIFSCHGSYEREDVLENGRALIKRFRSDRCEAYFLKQGYHYGFVCNSDSHKGHVGLNGLTAVYAKSLDKDSIFEAYRKRHIYGTTNDRIRLIFTGNGKLMGSVIPNSDVKIFMIDVIGENNLKKIDLFRNGVLYKRLIPIGKTFKSEFSVKDNKSSNWYVRVTQMDNQIAFSSPVFYE